jgi:hypothetical protein
VRLSPTEKRAFELLTRLYNDGLAFDVPPEDIDLQGIDRHEQPRVVRLADWRDKCAAAQLCASGKRKSEDRAFQRAVDGLVAKGKAQRFGEFAWLLGQERRPATSAKSDAKPTQRQHATDGDTPPTVAAGADGTTLATAATTTL